MGCVDELARAWIGKLRFAVSPEGGQRRSPTETTGGTSPQVGTGVVRPSTEAGT
jgi:hypothetical protein